MSWRPCPFPKARLRQGTGSLTRSKTARLFGKIKPWISGLAEDIMALAPETRDGYIAVPEIPHEELE